VSKLELNNKYTNISYNMTSRSFYNFKHYTLSPLSLKRRRGLIFNAGVNDADYRTEYKDEHGCRKYCPVFVLWRNMLQRCYTDTYPAYTKHSVCDKWMIFSEFRKYIIIENSKLVSQTGQKEFILEGRQLDKDIKTTGNYIDRCGKVYSPDNCLFVKGTINTFNIGCDTARGEYPIGVSFRKSSGMFRANCSNPFTNRYEHLGCCKTPEEAHQAWLKRKTELAHQYADQLDQSLYSGDHEAAFHLRRLFPKINP
jgi:hypothetical protein